MSTISPLTSNVQTSTTASAANPYNLQPSDFINMMVTQLKNQDPTQPMSNQDLLSQISQIGQLESSNQLETTMQTMQLQLNLGSGAALLGKTVQGADSSSNPVTGVVNSIQVAGGTVSLQLDSGSVLPLANVSAISPTTTSTNSN